MSEAMQAIANELATPAIETQQQNQTAEVNADEMEALPDEELAEGEDGEAEQAEPEYDEIEWEGKKYNIPKELKSGFMMNADYTRKTQEVAEQRKSVEAQKEQAAALYQASEDYIEAKAAVKMIEGQLQQYQNLNWTQLEQEDPMAAMSHWRQFQMLKEQHQQGMSYLHKADEERTANAQQEIAKRLQETRDFAAKEIPGYSIELEDKVAGFAIKELGFSVEQLQAAITPQVFRTLHLAWLGSQALQKKAAAPKPAAPPTQPLSKVTARANPTQGLDDRLSTEEWMKRRNAQARRGN